MYVTLFLVYYSKVYLHKQLVIAKNGIWVSKYHISFKNIYMYLWKRNDVFYSGENQSIHVHKKEL